jgi:hypothetical protein
MAKTIVDYASLNLQYRGDPFSAVRTIYLDYLGLPPVKVGSQKECEAVVYALIKLLLNKRDFGKAATLLWGPEKFSAEPYLVKLLWDHLDRHNILWVLGAGSVGKSYTVGVWHLLDWLCDPEWTSVKVLSATEQHAKTNVFAHLKDLHHSAIIQLPGKVMGESIRANEDESQGFQLMTVPQGPEARGRLRGFHPKPRPDAHSQFGTHSRIRVLMDEAEEIPGGAFEEVDNIMLTQEKGNQGVKVTGMTNPKDATSAFGQRCRPISLNGWNDIDEDSEAWEGQHNAQVISLDGAKSENVIEKRIVFRGFQTYEGFCGYEYGSPAYYTMCRGKFPKNAQNISVISQEIMNRAFQPLLWSGITIPLAAVDLAFDGKDKVKLAFGTYGMARGIKKGEQEVLFAHPKKCLQLNRIFDVGKADPEKKLTTSLYIAKEIQRICKDLGVTDSQLIVDKTGAGQGVDDILRHEFGPRVTGINYSQACTDFKILAEDSIKPSEVYDRIATEMMFAVKKWLEFDYLKFAHDFMDADLVNELTSRRCHTKGLKLKLESKADYKLRGNTSPDSADSCCLLTHLARLRSDELQMIWGMSDSEIQTQRRVDTMVSQDYIDWHSESPVERTHPMDQFYAEHEYQNTY